MDNPQLVLITGATGAVGPLVVEAFHAAGYSVRTLSIDAPPRDIWPEGIEAMSGDINDASVVQDAMQGVDAVIHLAALLHIFNPPPELREKYERINVGGSATVAAAATKAGVKRIVLFSTIAVYGQSGGKIVTEETPPDPDTFYAETKLAAEKIVIAAKNADGKNIGSVLRLGAVYGSRIKGNYEKLTRALARGRFIPIGRGQNRRTLIYDKDVARAALIAAFHPAAAGRIFNVTDGKFHTLKEIIGSICSALGRKEPRLSLPLGFSYSVADLIEKTGRFSGLKLPAVKTMIDKYTEDIAVDGSVIRRDLGFVAGYNLQAGWLDAVSVMKKTGVL